MDPHLSAGPHRACLLRFRSSHASELSLLPIVRSGPRRPAMPGVVRVQALAIALVWAGCAGVPAPRVVGAAGGCRVEADAAPAIGDLTGLRSPQVDAALPRPDGSLVVAYRPRLGLGISIRDAAGGWTHLAPATAPMR